MEIYRCMLKFEFPRKLTLSQRLVLRTFIREDFGQHLWRGSRIRQRKLSYGVITRKTSTDTAGRSEVKMTFQRCPSWDKGSRALCP